MLKLCGTDSMEKTLHLKYKYQQRRKAENLRADLSSQESRKPTENQ